MPAQYPGEIYTPRTMVNRNNAVYDAARTKDIYAEDFNYDRAEIVAIQEELGIDPKGAFASVKDWLSGLLLKSGGILTGSIDFAKYKAIQMACDNGTSFPASPATGQWFYRTDIKTLFQYEGGWKAIISYGSVTMYVDGTLGTDAVGQGYASGAGATKTIQYAVDLIPPINGGNVVVNLSADTFNEFLELGGKAYSGAYTITFQGVMLDKIGTRNVTSATASTCVIDGAALTVNAHVGQMVRITAGKGAGQYAPIISNTVDTITIFKDWANSGYNNSVQSALTPDATSDIVIEDFLTTVKQLRLSQGQQNVVLKNIYITGNSSDTNGNIYLRALSSMYISACKIKPTLAGTRGIFARDAAHLEIDNSYIEGGVASYRGIHLLSSASAFVVNTYINSANYAPSGGALYNSGGTCNLLGLKIDGLPANSNGVKLERNGVAIVGFNTATGNSFTSASGTGYDFLAVDGGAPSGLFGAWNTVTTYALFVDDSYIQYRSTTETFKTQSSAATLKALVTKAAAFQSANIHEWQKSDGTVLAAKDKDGIEIMATKTPSSASDIGTTGMVAWDASYIYVCTATNTWKRVAISTW